MSPPLDSLDRRLLDLLVEDSRIPVTGLARSLGVARSTVQLRLARLENRGVISGYTIRQNRDRCDHHVKALVSLVVDSSSSEDVLQALEKLSEVRSLYTVSGSVDLVALVICDSPGDLDQLLDRIGVLNGVQRTNSLVVLGTRIDR